MPSTTTLSADEAALREGFAAWSRALEAKDIDAMMANYADDIVLYDIKPPYVIRGKAAYRQIWEQCLPYFPEKFLSEHRDIVIQISGDLAVAHGVHRLKPIEPADHPCGTTWFRFTGSFRKEGGRWIVTHEHISVPYNPMTEKVWYITDPDDLSAPEWGPRCE
ncbi:MAG: nuclear transport factor 2 family protein [Candidatus Melainabacteria bacterium]